MNDILKRGSILIESYRRANIEQYAAASRLKNAQDLIEEEEIVDLEEVVYYPYEKVIDAISYEIALLCRNIPVYKEFLSKVPGLTMFDSLHLLVMLKDIERFDNISHLWSYAGLAPVKYCNNCNKRYFETQSEAEDWYYKHRINKRRMKFLPYCTCNQTDGYYYASNRRIKGMNPDYNEELKKLLILIGNKLLQRDGYYKQKYLKFRDDEYNKDLNLTDIHIENRAKRKVVKIFLYDLFNHWREADGLDAVEPYAKLPEYQEETN